MSSAFATTPCISPAFERACSAAFSGFDIAHAPILRNRKIEVATETGRRSDDVDASNRPSDDAFAAADKLAAYFGLTVSWADYGDGLGHFYFEAK